jgi:outer membrane protein insertion porin family
VAISPDKQDISIAINVTEGARYVVSGVKLEGNYLDKDDEFKSLVTIKPGQAYNADQVAETTKAFTDYFGNFGLRSPRSRPSPRSTASTTGSRFVLQAEPRAAPMCAASTSAATTARATRWCAASSASSSRRGTTPNASAVA